MDDELTIKEEEQFYSLISVNRRKWYANEIKMEGKRILNISCLFCNFTFGSEHIQYEPDSNERNQILEGCIQEIYKHESEDCDCI